MNTTIIIVLRTVSVILGALIWPVVGLAVLLATTVIICQNVISDREGV